LVDLAVTNRTIEILQTGDITSTIINHVNTLTGKSNTTMSVVNPTDAK